MELQGREQATSWQQAPPTSDAAINVNYSHYVPKKRYKCNRCHRVFVYAKLLENHMLTCMNIAAWTAKALGSEIMSRGMHMEDQAHTSKNAGHYIDLIKEESDLESGAVEQPRWTYRTTVPEKLQSAQPSEANIEDLIVAYHMKKPPETRKNEENFSQQAESHMGQVINTNPPVTSKVSFARNDSSDPGFLSEELKRLGHSKSLPAFQIPQVPAPKQLNHNQKTSRSSLVSSAQLREYRFKHLRIQPQEFYSKPFEHHSSSKEQQQQNHEIPRYECTICEKRYASAAALETHQMRHLKMKPHKCTTCYQGFGTRFALNRHFETHVGGKTFKDASAQTLSVKAATNTFGDVRLEPEVNDVRFVTPPINQSLLIAPQTTEIRTVGEEVPKNIIKEQLNMPRAHAEVEVNKRTDSCDQKVFLNRSSNEAAALQRDNPRDGISHIPAPTVKTSSSQSLAPRLYKCFLCPVECLNFRELEKHGRAQHLDRDAYKCIGCFETFKQPAGIKTHIAMFHADEGLALHGCNHCGAIFLALAGLHYHLKDHLLHKCAACQKGFETFTDLKTHVEGHSECRESSAIQGKNGDSQLAGNTPGPSSSRQSRTGNKTEPREEEQNAENWMDEDAVSSETANQRDVNSTDDRADLPGTIEKLTEKGESPADSSLTQKSSSRAPREKKSRKAQLAKKAYDCHICEKSFALERNLRQHLEGHIKIYSCDQCDASFPRSVQLNAHKTQHLKDEGAQDQEDSDSEEEVKVLRSRKSQKCEHNGASSQRSNQLGDKAHECKVCKQSFDSARDLKKHQRKLKTPYKCNQCGESFEEADEFKAHQTKHAEEKAFKCHICEKSFGLERYLRRHHRRTHAKSKYKCDQCDATFSRPDHRKAHQQRHKAHVCQICSKSFSKERHLEAHHKTEHKKKEEKSFECDKCDERFKRSDELKAHQVQHLPAKEHVCPICNKSLHPMYLKTHIEGHEGKWRFKCNLCDRSFGSKDSLKEHKNRHLGIKPHKCKKCDDAFVTIYGLRRHMSVHLADHLRKKPHDCSLCDQSFTTNAHLKRHIGRKHTPKPKSSKNKETTQTAKESPLTCRICHKRFNRGQLLNEHLKRKHVGLRSYGCGYCVDTFVTPTELEAHLKQHLVHKCTSCRTGFSTLTELKQHLKLCT